MAKTYHFGEGVYYIYCPGCKSGHSLSTQKPNSNGAQWGFSGDLKKPTFTPSLHVKGECGETGAVTTLCHSFIRDGHIQYLSDSAHDLKGQTIELPEIDDIFSDDDTEQDVVN